MYSGFLMQNSLTSNLELSMSPMSILLRKTRDLQIAEINLLIWLIGLLFENFKDTDESYDSCRFVLSYFHDVQKFHVLLPQCIFFFNLLDFAFRFNFGN